MIRGLGDSHLPIAAARINRVMKKLLATSIFTT
jgi:hypothetical protein